MDIDFTITGTTGITYDDNDTISVTEVVEPLGIEVIKPCGNVTVTHGAEYFSTSWPHIPIIYGAHGPWPMPNDSGARMKFWARVRCNHEGEPHGTVKMVKTLTLV